MNIYIIAIALYIAILILISYLASRKVKGGEDFMVGGRKLNKWLIFATLIGGNIGAGSTIGITGLAYTSGISVVWWMISSGVGSIILALVVGPKIWELSGKYNLLTCGDFLEKRYSKYFKGIFSSMMFIGTLALFAAQLMGVSWILNVTAGTSKITGIIIGAAVVAIYFALGGIVSSAYVGVLKLIVVLSGFILALPFALSAVGGFGGLHDMVAANFNDQAQTTSYFSFFGIGASMIIGYFFMLTPSFFVSPGLIGIVYGAKDKAAVRQGTLLNALVQCLFAFIPAIIGMCAFAMFPNLTAQDTALPTAVTELMPTAVAAITIAAVVAAEISTADTVLYMLNGSFTNDIYRTFINPNLSDKGILRMSRGVTLVSGVLGVIIAIYLSSIISALTIFYTLMSVSLTAPLLFGLFSTRPTAAAASVSAVIGVGLTLILTYGFSGFKLFGILNAQTSGILISLIVMLVMVMMFPSRAFKKGTKHVELDNREITVAS